MISRLLIGDNNLSKFWPAYQFGRPSLKGSTLVVATDLDTLDNALAQAEDREQVLNSFLLKFEIFQCLAGFQCEDSSFCRGSFRSRGVSGFNGSNVSEDRSKGSNCVRVSSVSLLCGMGFNIGDTSRADEGSSQLEGSVAMVFEGSMMFNSVMIEIG